MTQTLANIQYWSKMQDLDTAETDERWNLVADYAMLIARAQHLTGLQTEREIILEALRALIHLREQERQTQAQEDLRALRGQLKWEGDLDEQRLSRLEGWRESSCGQHGLGRLL